MIARVEQLHRFCKGKILPLIQRVSALDRGAPEPLDFMDVPNVEAGGKSGNRAVDFVRELCRGIGDVGSGSQQWRVIPVIYQFLHFVFLF